MDTISTPQWLIVIGIILIILEVMTPGFVMLPMGIAFLITAGFSFFITETSALLTALAANLFVVFYVFIKFIRPKYKKRHVASNFETLIGQVATVEEDINNDIGTGYVKVYSDSWRALSEGNTVIVKGKKVKILKIDGNKVIVRED